MKKIIVLLTLLSLFFSTAILAHVSNEKTLYDDIEFSEAKEEIVYLRGLNVIAYEHGAHLFKPQQQLTKEDLAFWVGTFKGLGSHEADKEEIKDLALDQGLVDSLQGSATYEDVNQAYFDGFVQTEKSQEKLTREEFAIFMGQFLEESVNQKTLFDMAGYEKGPSGVIEKVISETEGEGDEAYKIFSFSIDGKEYQVSKHPKILYGPVDLGVWEGKEIKKSWFAPGHGDKKLLEIIVVNKGEFSDKEIANENTKETHTNQSVNHNPSDQKDEVVEQPEKAFPIVPVIGIVLLVVIFGWLFMRKK